ncbi:MAG: metallophosphoesterase [Clostridia bacterium]|nr:metallophosphoesterase [Clostridia bacterium]
MKKLISVILAISILMSVVVIGASAQDDGTMSFAVASDLHYVEPTEPVEHNIDDPIFYYANRRAQMEHESGFIIDEFLRQCAEDDDCDFVLIPGDLANDGKVILQQHLDVAEKLAKFEKETGKQVYVIDGNHDLGYDCETTPEVFKEVYYEFGYKEALTVFEDNCSYTANIGDKYRLIALDSCDPSKSTEDGLTTDKLFWALEQADIAKEDGKYPILMMHHNLLDHLPVQRIISRNFIVRWHYSTAELFADHGIKLVFTGHEHCSDAATFTSALGNVIYDFATTSLSMYPLEYRMFHITDEEIKYENKKITSIDTQALSAAVPDLTDEQLALMDEDFEAYSKEFFHHGIKYRLGRGMTMEQIGMEEGDFFFNIVNAAVTGLTDMLDMPFYGENSIQELAKEYGLEIPDSDYETPWHLVTSLVGMHYAGSEYYDLESTEVTMLLRTLVLILRVDFANITDALFLVDLANKALATFGIESISDELTKLGIKVFGSVNVLEYAILGLISPLLYAFAYDDDGVEDNNGTLPGYGTVDTLNNLSNITANISNIINKIISTVTMMLKYALKGFNFVPVA